MGDRSVAMFDECHIAEATLAALNYRIRSGLPDHPTHLGVMLAQMLLLSSRFHSSFGSRLAEFGEVCGLLCCAY
jgi:hypothetical protein